MVTRLNQSLRTGLRTLLIVVVALTILPVLLFVGVRLVGVSVLLINVLALPLAISVLIWFVYRLWGRPYLRAWHINRIRNARYLREVIERGKESN